MNKRIILAAGHGGGDSGATGQGTTEAVECIQIVNRAADKLRADGQLEVVVVPHELGLVAGINWVNARYKNLEDALCIEVHKNATVNAHGIEVWYWGKDTKSQALAQALLGGIMTVAGMPTSRGAKGDDTNRWGSLGWIRETNPWALLVEMGFVSDGGDAVDDPADDRYAEGLKLGVLRVFGLTPKAPQPVPLPEPPTPPGTVPGTPAPKYRVYSNTAQIGAYNTQDGAWNKYVVGGVKIVEVASDRDVTAEFVAKYRPKVDAPLDTEPHPTPKPTGETNTQAPPTPALPPITEPGESLYTVIAQAVEKFINWLKSFKRKG